MSYRMTITAAILSAIAIATAPTPAASRPKAELYARKPVEQLHSAAAYAAANAGLNCANLENRATDIISINKAWSALSVKSNVADGSIGDKREFETTSAYHDRLDDYWTKSLGGSNIIVIEKSLKVTDYHYDADKNVISIVNPIRYAKHYSDNYKKYESGIIDAFYSQLSHSSYSAKNAYGLSKQVYKDRSVQGELIFNPKYKLESSIYRRDEYVLDIPITLEEAKLFSNKMKITYLARKITPFTVTGLITNKPTINDPFDDRVYLYGFNIEPMCIIVKIGNKKQKKFDFYDSKNQSDPTPTKIVYSPKPLSAPENWLNSHDYPSRSVREGHYGISRYKLSVGADGRVNGCEITSSSGYIELDELTCHLIPRRARFTPANESNGQAIFGIFNGEHSWKIPN